MAALKKSPAKGKRPPKKGIRGRMPVKRSINLMLVDENKISPAKALPAVILIVVLAAAFSKFLVADRLMAMSQASGRVSTLQSNLEQAKSALGDFEGVENRYAHLTYAGMTSEELERVDRVKVLELVSTILPEGDYVKSWNVSSNILTVDITGRSLQDLNELARKIEESPIVDVCAIATAKKDERGVQVSAADTGSLSHSLAEALEKRRNQVENGLESFVLATATNILLPLTEEKVDARFTIYLVQPPETEDEPEADAAQDSEQADAGAGREALSDDEAAQTGEVVRANPRKPSRSSYSAVLTGAVQASEPEEVSAP